MSRVIDKVICEDGNDNILFKNMYNMNENRFSVEKVETSKYIINTQIRQEISKIKSKCQE